MTWWVLFGTVGWAAECDPEPVLRTAEDAVVGYYLADARADLVRVVDAFSCSGRAEPELVGRLFAAEGMVRLFEEDLEGMRRAFSAARVASLTSLEEVAEGSCRPRSRTPRHAATPAP